MWYDYEREILYLKKNGNKIQNKDLNCNAKNVVNIIECSKCKEIYIEST